MGRAPCCDKANVKKGQWSPEEDAKLKSFIEQNGTGGNWIALPGKIGLKRCGKSCRLRWLNYLRPNIKHGCFSEEEDRVICGLYVSIGSRWSIIAAQLPGRTDNDIKNYWNTKLKKKFMGKQRKEIQAHRDRIQKQEMKKWSESSTKIVSNNYSQTPHWPELPVLSSLTHSNEEPRSNNHDSIRKFLLKIGGRFADDDKILHQGINLQFSTQTTPINHIFEQSTDTFCETGSQFDQNQFAPDEVGLPLLEGQSSNGGEQLQQNVVQDSSKGLLGLEFLFEEENIGDGFSTTSCNWGEISSLIGPCLYPCASENVESSYGRIL